jgi:hypothetical protein
MLFLENTRKVKWFAMVEVVVQVGTDDYVIAPNKVEQIVAALAQFGYKADLRMYVAAEE